MRQNIINCVLVECEQWRWEVVAGICREEGGTCHPHPPTHSHYLFLEGYDIFFVKKKIIWELENYT